MIKKILLLALLLSAPAFSQTTAPQVLGCTNPAPAAPGASTVFFSKCVTPAFLPTSTSSVIASASKTAPVWAHSLSGYSATDLIVACPAGAVVSGASCTVNGVDASGLVARSNVPTFSIIPVVTSTTGTLSWTIPFQNTDGSTLMDLASFNIYQGSSPSTLTKIGTADGGTQTYSLSGLTVGSSYSFGVSAVNSAGAESDKQVISQGVSLPKVPKAPTGLTLSVP